MSRANYLLKILLHLRKSLFCEAPMKQKSSTELFSPGWVKASEVAFYQPPPRTMSSNFTRSREDIEEWTRNDIKERLEEKNRWLIEGLITIYNKQTATEKRCKGTHERNGVGFNSADAGFLTDVAEQAVETKDKYGSPRLTEAQIKAVRDNMLKYSQQLADIANGDR